MSIETIISNYLKENNLSQQEAADKLGVSQAALHNWLSGKNKPSGDHLKRIYEVCEVPFFSKHEESKETENSLLRKLLEAKDEQIALMKEMLNERKEKG